MTVSQADSILRTLRYLEPNESLEAMAQGNVVSGTNDSMASIRHLDGAHNQSTHIDITLAGGEVVSTIDAFVKPHVSEGWSQYRPADIRYYASQWSGFSPENLVKTLGDPTDVYLFTYARGPDWEPITRRWIYDLWMVYAKQGLIVYYGGRAGIVKGGKEYEICPSFRYGNATWSGVSVTLTDPSMITDAEKWMRKELNLDDEDPPMNIESASHISVAEYSKLVLAAVRERRPKCFCTAVEIWPY
jgi:hypothetical protein